MESKKKDRANLLICILLAAATIAVYAQVYDFGFVNFDDPSYVRDNPWVSQGLRWRGVLWAFTAIYEATWQPMTWLSLMADTTLGGGLPDIYHITNVLIHVLSVLILFLTLLVATGAVGRSAFVAALFAVHPLHVESVAWIAERKDVLSGLFWMLTMLAYVRWANRRLRSGVFVVSSLFALGLMAKPMLVSLPIVLLLLDFWPLGRYTPMAMEAGAWTALARLIREKWPLFALAAASCAVTFWAQKAGGAVKPFALYPPGVRLANAGFAYVSYLGKALWPLSLSPFYPHAGSTLPVWQVVGSWGLLVVVTWAAIRFRGRTPYLFVGWIWYVVTLVPVIGLVQIGTHGMADRFTYIPAIGLFLVVAWGACDLACELKVIGKWASLVCAVLGTATITSLVPVAHRQVGYWRNTKTLCIRALRITQDNWIAHQILASALLQDWNLEGAERHYRLALRINPDDGFSHNGIAAVLMTQGRFESALEHLKAACRLYPRNASGWYNLGSCLARLGRYEYAARAFGRAVQCNPDDVGAVRRRAEALTRLDRYDEAVQELQSALRKHPEDSELAAALEETRELWRGMQENE